MRTGQGQRGVKARAGDTGGAEPDWAVPSPPPPPTPGSGDPTALSLQAGPLGSPASPQGCVTTQAGLDVPPSPNCGSRGTGWAGPHARVPCPVQGERCPREARPISRGGGLSQPGHLRVPRASDQGVLTTCFIPRAGLGTEDPPGNKTHRIRRLRALPLRGRAPQEGDDRLNRQRCGSQRQRGISAQTERWQGGREL